MSRDTKDTIKMLTVIVIVIFIIVGIPTLIYNKHVLMDITMNKALDNNKTIFCGFTDVPVSHELGYKTQGERVFGNGNSWDMSQGCYIGD